ncbi:unnamed protein product [Sphagnum jensenii]|uniref:ABC transporter D family member 2, chloroplastic n=1 Tax=Sphagnum jensenii TaxID=128206 RepID=A0ABP0WTG1_9BRYO
MSNFCFAQACSSSNSSFTTVALRSCGQVSRISLPPPPPPPSCTEFNNFKYRVRRRFQSPSYLRRSSLHSACSYSLPFPLASSLSASRGSFSGYRRRKLEVRASASELFQQEHGEGKPTESTETPDIAPQSLRNDPAYELKRVGSNLSTLLRRFWKVAAPYWSSEDKVQARLRLAGLFALTLATTGISVGFNFLGRDFDNALASKNREQFTKQLVYYLGAFAGGIPVFVLRDYLKDTLALRWRGWMTSQYMHKYFQNRTFYNIQSQALIDNPDQRIVDDLNSFTGTALGFSLAVFNAAISVVSFSRILYQIYPPLFFVLIVYSVGGTVISVALGKALVGLNFMQEKREADFRYGLVRVRENAESIAFYGGEMSEIQLLLQRFKQSFDNCSQLLKTSRNLNFFTDFYQYLIQLLPAAVVAPLYFAGKIDFGVINQSFSAFNIVLNDFSLIVNQFQAISAFSAVVDRLGEFSDSLDQQNQLSQANANTLQATESNTRTQEQIVLVEFQEFAGVECASGQPLLEIQHLTLYTPQYTMTLIEDLSFVVKEGESLMIMGASGCGKTSLLRAVAGLWQSGSGTIKCFMRCKDNESAHEEHKNGASMVEIGGMDVDSKVFFLPQRPYMVLGTLRQQLLYPTWNEEDSERSAHSSDSSGNLPFLSGTRSAAQSLPPNDNDLTQVLECVRLGHLMDRPDGLDSAVEWASVLSLGEQQRLAFARLLLSRPQLALMDESTSALDEDNEAHLYKELKRAGVTYISVGHRSSLLQFHANVLQFQRVRGNDSGCTWTVKPLPQLD